MRIAARSVTASDGARFSSDSAGEGNAGTVTVEATETATFVGSGPDSIPTGAFSRIQLGGRGNAGGVNIVANAVEVLDGAGLSSSTSGEGDAGAVTVDAIARATFAGTAPDGSRSGAFNTVDVFAEGDAGATIVRAGTVSVTGGAVLDSRTFGRGDAGSVLVEARDAAIFDGPGPSSFPSGAFSGAEFFAQGSAGDVEVRARTISVTGGAQLDSSTFATGDAGTVVVEALETVVFDGTDPNGFPSGAFTTVQDDGNGNAGSTIVRANVVSVTNGATLSTSTFGNGNAGTTIVEAGRVNLDRGGTIDSFADAFASGDAGGVQIFADSISLTGGSEIATNSEVTAVESTAGNVFLQAESVRLEDESAIAADTRGRGGNIEIDSDAILLRRSSRLEANASGDFPGGNITLDTELLSALENSDITANALNAAGGRITIDAKGIFATQFRNAQTLLSDITATSALGPAFSGIVELNTPNIDPATGLIDLAINPVDAEALGTDPCAAGRGSAFYITGLSGLPRTPNVAFPSFSGAIAWLDAREVAEAGLEASTSAPDAAPIVEARNWYADANGQVVLTANTARENARVSLHPQSSSCVP